MSKNLHWKHSTKIIFIIFCGPHVYALTYIRIASIAYCGSNGNLAINSNTNRL